MKYVVQWQVRFVNNIYTYNTYSILHWGHIVRVIVTILNKTNIDVNTSHNLQDKMATHVLLDVIADTL